MRPVACSPASDEGQNLIQNPPNIACPLPERFDGDKIRRLLVRHVNESARQAVRAAGRHRPRRGLNDVLLCAGRDAHHPHPSFFSNVDVDTLQDRNLLRRRDVSLRG